MDNLFEETRKELVSQNTWDKTAVVTKLLLLRDKIKLQLQGDQLLVQKKWEVDEIKKYDVIFMPTFGTMHYILVYKVKDGIVYGFSMTTKDFMAIHRITKDRTFKANITTSLVQYPVEEAKKNFIRVFENKAEADEIFKKIKNYYKEILNLK